MNCIRVTVPATTANMGPGFDCLGLALGLHNVFEVRERKEGEPLVEVVGETKGLPLDETNLVIQVMTHYFQEVGQEPAPYRLLIRPGVPVSSGLGSSSTAVVGGLLAADAWVSGGKSREEIAAMAVGIEGHPDNVVPALYGGLVVAAQTCQGLVMKRLEVAALQAVVVLPDFALSTEAARAALPVMVPLADAVFNLGHLGVLLTALATGDYDLLGVAMGDRLHQPYRTPLIPGWEAAAEAARLAGAKAVALSGAGPSLIAWGVEGHEAIGRAAEAAFTAAGVASQQWILAVDQRGSWVEMID